MTYLTELVRQVMESLLRNKLRSFLTMAGIAWGITSIVLIVAMGDGFKEGQRNSTKSLGENLVILFGGRTELQAGGERAGRRIRLNYKDVENLRRECYLVKLVAAELQNNLHATSPFNSGAFDVSGVEAHFTQIRTIPIDQGRFFSEEEEKSGQRVCIIGSDVKKQLFGTRPNVNGSQMALNGIPYRIIGIMASKEQNSSYSGLDEKKIFLPYTAMIRDVPPVKNYTPGYLDEILYQPRSLEQYEEAQLQVKKVLGRAHGFSAADKSAIGIWDTVENQQQVNGIFDSMTVFLGFIGFVTLSLGGIGVMNIMLVTVSERTREIGLRKALGATKHRILVDFLAEGCVLAFTSGIIGWGVAFGLSSSLKLVKMPEMFPGLPVSAATSAIAFATLSLIAIASALYPAWRAAALTPVEALRYER
ncbi:MAG: putative transport system permease protein [Bryobacterales bacterium]|jgi:putative ABC transport system permease protein|nr:putative transport system permease protein [Bryobacterales bacterium]